MSVYAPLLGTLWRTLESYGVDPGQVVDEAHYRPNRASLISERVDFAEYDAAMARAYDLVKDPAIGIRSAKFLHPSHLGALGYAWLASPSLRVALRLGQRFRHMYNEQVETELQELPDRIRVIYALSEPTSRPDPVADAHLASLLMLCRLDYGDKLMPIEVNLKRERPDDLTPWLEYFGIEVAFGQDENSLAISAEDADKPLTGSNPELVAVHEDVIERYLLKLSRHSIVNRIRLNLMEQLPAGRVTENDMAGILSMSKRTLHRKLRDHGETFRSLLAQVRMDLAERYISEPNFSITEIAFLLGYNDTSAFSRAFRSWFGMSPTQARERTGAA